MFIANSGQLLASNHPISINLQDTLTILEPILVILKYKKYPSEWRVWQCPSSTASSSPLRPQNAQTGLARSFWKSCWAAPCAAPPAAGWANAPPGSFHWPTPQTPPGKCFRHQRCIPKSPSSSPAHPEVLVTLIYSDDF